MFRFLFYSLKCDKCNNMLKIMENEGIIGSFKLYCIDNMTVQQISNLNLNTVPTIVFQQPDGRGSQIFEAGDAFKWLNSLIQNRRQNYMQMMEMNRRNILKHNANINKSMEGPQGYKPSEMSGVSDDYSYISIDCAQPKQYMTYGQDENLSILTIKDNNGKIDERQQKEIINNYERSRNVQTEQLNKMMEQQLINTIYNAEVNGTQF